MNRRLTSLALLLCLIAPSAGRARTWTDATGKHTLDADLADLNDGKVVLRRPDGQILAIDLDQFSQADREYVRREIERRRSEQKAEVSDRPGTVAYGPGRQLGTLANHIIDESSGMACSRATPGVFWTHNDSGDLARVYAFDRQGKDLGWCELPDVFAYDFEDMASLTLDKKHYLLVGDTGNNGLTATVQILYLVEEPAVDTAAKPVARKVPIVQVMHYSYEDDHRNCEAVAVDPTDKTILLVTKEKVSSCFVYALAWPKNDPKKATVARKIATLKIPPATAMDVSPEGRRAIVLTYAHAYEYTRRDGEDWRAAFSRKPCQIVLPPRIQGESICYGPDGKTLYLTSEKLPTPLWEVPVSVGAGGDLGAGEPQ